MFLPEVAEMAAHYVSGAHELLAGVMYGIGPKLAALPCLAESAEPDQLCFWSIIRTPDEAASMAPAMYPGNCGDHSLPIPINRPAQGEVSKVGSKLNEYCPPSSKS